MDSKDGEAKSEETAKHAPQIQSMTLDVVKIIFEAQQRHGLRHEDYQRYCTYCTKRLRKLRKSLKLNCHYVGKKFVMPDVLPEKITDIRFFHIPLFQAERAWAYSIELKREMNTEPRKRFQQIRRMKRAVKHAETLKMLSESDICDARTKLECQAYCLSMQGLLRFEMENWQQALDLFTKARHIYERLYEVIIDSDEKSIYKHRIDEFLPNIRYCAYHIGDKSAFDDLINMRVNATGETAGMLESLLNETLKKQAELSTEIVWNGRKISVRNKQIRLFLLNLKELETKKNQCAEPEMKLKWLDSILKETIDVLQALRDELKADNNYHAFQRGQEVAEPLSVNLLCFSYLSHLRLLRTAERDLLFIYEADQGKFVAKASKPQDIARLYEHIIQNLNDMKNVPIISTNKNFIQQCNLLIKVIRAQRVLTISQAFAGSSKFKEAAAFLLKAKMLAEEILKDNIPIDEKISELLPSIEIRPILTRIIEKCDAEELSLRTSAFIEPSVPEKGKVNPSPIIEQLDEENLCFDFSTVPVLVAVPPTNYRPLPCKPLFFDLAYDNVSFPSLLDEIKPADTHEEAKGFTGFVKGLWSWGR